MDIFSLITLLGGLAFFLYGMNVMSGGLEKLAGSKLEVVLKKMTSNKFKSLTLGMGITIAIQSSSALTVMLVGLVNSGIMELSQTTGVIMGSHVGTTLTSWILSLSGIESDSFFLKMLKPESFSPIIALIGVIMIMTSKHNKNKDIGRILVGFSVLMEGMSLMSDSVSPLADSEQFSSLLTAFHNPFMGVIVGTVFTGIIQSSAASVGILQALSMTGKITYGMSIPVVIGLNIGTCVTALISSIGVNRSAKRVAVVHICSNLIGMIILLPLFYILNAFFDFAFVETAIAPVGVALVHTIFNVVTTAMLMPFFTQLERFAYIIIKDDRKISEDKEKYELLDERLLSTPAVAIEVCGSVTAELAELSRKSIGLAVQILFNYDDDLKKQIRKTENEIDEYEDKLNAFLVRICKHSIATKSNRKVSIMLHCIGNFERIGDHAVNILDSAEELYKKGIRFSGNAAKELKVFCDAMQEILDLAVDAFKENDIEKACHVEPLEEIIDELNVRIKARHIDRLQHDACTVELGYIYQDLLTNIERIADHCSNIAVCLIRITDGNYETHEYLREIRAGGRGFKKDTESFKQKYALPERERFELTES